VTRAQQLLIPALLAGDARPEDVAPTVATELLEVLGPLVGRLAARAAVGDGRPAMAPEPEGDRLVTPREAADRLGVTLDWLYRHCDRIGGRRLTRRTMRFPESALVRFMAEEGA
jgi:hypothetical protein